MISGVGLAKAISGRWPHAGGSKQGLAAGLTGLNGLDYWDAKQPKSYVQPSIFDILAGASPASAMDGWAE
jgi:hypothetical protein